MASLPLTYPTFNQQEIRQNSIDHLYNTDLLKDEPVKINEILTAFAISLVESIKEIDIDNDINFPSTSSSGSKLTRFITDLKEIKEVFIKCDIVFGQLSEYEDTKRSFKLDWFNKKMKSSEGNEFIKTFLSFFPCESDSILRKKYKNFIIEHSKSSNLNDSERYMALMDLFKGFQSVLL